MSDGADAELAPTAAQTIGPFWHGFLRENGTLVGPEAHGDRIRLAIQVVDGDSEPVTDAMIEIWQADAAGVYHHPADPRSGTADTGFRGFGRLRTNRDGSCEFETVRPGRVPGPDGALQAPHVSVSIFARGLLDRLTTRAYFAGDPANGDDPVFARVLADRRDRLLASRDPERPDVWNFAVRLHADDETVFFEI